MARHALAGLNYIANRYSREENEGGGGGQTGEGQQGESGKGKEFTPITSQEELDRIVSSRVNRTKAQYRDYETLQEKARMWDELERESQTDREREVTEAREEAFQEVMTHAVPRIVKAEFKAQAHGRLSKEQLDSLLEDLDLIKYATDDGEPDEEKIAKKIDTIAGGRQNGQNGGRGPGFGQGSGYGTSSPKKGEAGLREAERRFGKLAETKSS